jgi:hypothetical protein
MTAIPGMFNLLPRAENSVHTIANDHRAEPRDMMKNVVPLITEIFLISLPSHERQTKWN